MKASIRFVMEGVEGSIQVLAVLNIKRPANRHVISESVQDSTHYNMMII